MIESATAAMRATTQKLIDAKCHQPFNTLCQSDVQKMAHFGASNPEANIRINLVQIMGNIAVSGDMDLFADGNKLIFEVHEFGAVDENCANVGPVFNPLENPYYDTPST